MSGGMETTSSILKLRLEELVVSLQLSKTGFKFESTNSTDGDMDIGDGAGTPIIPGHETEVVLHQVHVEILAGCWGGGYQGHVAVRHDGAEVTRDESCHQYCCHIQMRMDLYKHTKFLVKKSHAILLI